MRIPLDHQSDISLYQQIENFLRQGIQSGSLEPGTRLPSTRQLAESLGISRITAENAYAELKADGLISSQSGSGTYVLPPCPLPSRNKDKSDSQSWPLWQLDLFGEQKVIETTTIGEVSPITHNSNIISFALGNGDPQMFPIEDFRRATYTVLKRDGIAALQYGEHKGFTQLRSTIAHILGSQGMGVGTENILITSGSQQALTLVSQLLLKPGDVVFVESPTYAVALELFTSLGVKIIGIPMDREGMLVDRLEELLQQFQPKMIYTIPNFHNPTGTCLSSWRRRQLLALASHYNLPIIEDDFVGDLRYDGRSQPALKSLDPGGWVIYISTFSKMLLPGLRIGFMVAEGPIYQALVNHKYIQDLATSNLSQRTLENYVNVGRYQTHLRRSCQVYRKRRDAMLFAIQRYLPTEVSFTPPQGGLFFWLQLPGNLSVQQLTPIAYKEGVTFASGDKFFTNPMDGNSFIRLNFAPHPPEIIEEGIKRLGKAMIIGEQLFY